MLLHNHDCENILNTNIHEEEVLAAVKQLKNNKASILCKRLEIYVENESQTGFRKGYSTLDSIF